MATSKKIFQHSCVIVLLLVGLCLLLQIHAAGACSANQQALVNLMATEDDARLLDGSSELPANATCQWNLTAPVGKIISIGILLVLEDTCDNDHFRIYDGPNNSSHIIKTFCFVRNDWLIKFFSSGRSLFLEAKTGHSSRRRLVVVNYRAMQECSRNTSLDAPESPTQHNFSSLYYPEVIYRNKTCGWYITAPEDHFLKVQLRVRSAFSDADVEVYDVDGSGNTFAVNLKWKVPWTATVFSNFRKIYILLKTQPSFKADGIFVWYTALKPANSCSASNTEGQNSNIRFQNPSGLLQSPGYPSKYPLDLVMNCVWKIVAPQGQVVRLEILSLRMGDGCCLDVQDGIGKENTFEFSKCGTRPSPFVVYSSGRYLNLKAITEDCRPGPGFIANYSFVPEDAASRNCNLTANSIMHISGKGGSFGSSGFLYPGLGTCGWNITVPQGKLVKLTFWRFLNFCKRNYAEVFDMTNSTRDALTGRFCSEKVVFSNRNSVYVRYSVTADDRPQRGFWASYEAVDALKPATYSCSNERRSHLTGNAGEFASFDYPLLYPNGAACSWEIDVPPTHLVQLTFKLFDLQPSPDCTADYVEIKQGGSYSQSQVVGKFCGSLPLTVFALNHSKVFVDFVSDSSGRYPGFHASFRALPNPATGPCKLLGVDNVIPLVGNTGRLFSPLYPQTYPPNISCTWMITVPEGKFVKLKIRYFHLESSCGGPVLEIRDGQRDTSNLLKSFCGHNFERSVFSTGRHLWVRFRSSNMEDLSGTGFNAVFEAVNQSAMGPCKLLGVDNVIPLVGNTGRLFSPLYPETYPSNISCTWMITVPEGKFVKLKITSFYLEFSCGGPVLEIRDGHRDTSNLLKSFCGRNFESSVFSTGRHLWVRFRSSNIKYLFGTGFNAVFEAVNQLPAPFACSERNKIVKFQSETGILASYNYPLPYDTNIECQWLISVDLDYKIELSFEFFNLSRSRNCSEDYVVVRHGLSFTSYVLGKFCGSDKPQAITSDGRHLRVEFKSSGKTKYPGFKASYETKKSTTAILKIVGIVLGVLSPVCTAIGYCCHKCQKSSDYNEAAVQHPDNSAPVEDVGMVNHRSKEETTPL